jgi:hypothetical protein
MKQSEIIQKLSKLPEDMLQSASDYIDFLLQKAKKDVEVTTNKKRNFGKNKHLISWIAPDFNAPLDDLKEYM